MNKPLKRRQINCRITELHHLMIRNLKEKHNINTTEVITKSIEFYFEYFNDLKKAC
jgi:hypothetical protein